MSSISVVSASFCHADEIILALPDRVGFRLIGDDALVGRAAERSGMSEHAVGRAFSARRSVFNSFTRDRERAVAHLKLAVAEAVVRDKLVIAGLSAVLVPTAVSHVLRVCLVADARSRIETAQATAGLGDKAALREIRRHDEDLTGWVSDHRGVDDPWQPSLYDIVLPTDKTPSERAIDLIVESLRSEAVRPTAASLRAAEDFLVAARVEQRLAGAGHHVDVACADGHVTLTINKHVLMLGRLEDELKEIAGPVDGVRSVDTVVGKEFYQTDIYRKVDFETPSRVLLVDDEREFVQTLSERLEMRDVGSAVAYDGESALRMVSQDEPDVMILDLKMPGIDGIEVLRRVKRMNPRIEVIILTGHGSDDDCRTCMELGAFAYLQKPVDIEALSETLRRANQKARESSRRADPEDDPTP
ncbi:MAG: response regulator [Thermoanaerobaculales bacterium]|jgi:CheY-like chemotaxis protein|nr:response regulator [Thermoanaerobaculales bacterium]